jgi:hypothetical protein
MGSATGPRTATCLVTAKDDQRRERGMTVDRLDGVYGLDRQHHGAQPAHPTVADHRAAPPSRLQGAAEPSPPLTEQCLAQPVVLSQ